MAKRKYVNYILEEEDGDFMETSNWQSAFGAYMRSDSATIYGLPTYEGACYEPIMSK